MKKILIIGIVILSMIAVVLILLNNKAKIESKANKTGIETVHTVTIANVESRTLDRTLSIIGISSPEKEVIVSSETQGRIKTVNFDVGDRVEAGKVLVTVDDEIKKASLLSAEASLEKTKKDYERFETLNKEGSVNDAQFDAAKLAYKSAQSQYTIALKQLNDTKIISPLSGFVTMKNIETGSLISNYGTPVATIIDLKNVKVKVAVPEEDVFKLKVGNTALLETDIYPGTSFEGKIKSIGYKGDEAHSYPVEIIIPNNNKFPLKAGMFVNVKFPSVIKKECLTIPRRALIGGIKRPQVYIVENGIAKIRDIIIGEDMNDMLEVLSGISVSEKVVIDGQINLKDGSSVKISN